MDGREGDELPQDSVTSTATAFLFLAQQARRKKVFRKEKATARCPEHGKEKGGCLIKENEQRHVNRLNGYHILI